MRVCFYPSNIDAAGCYRCLFPARELRRQFGWLTGMGSNKTVEGVDQDGRRQVIVQFDIGRVPDADLYVLQQPLDKLYLQLIRFLRKEGKTVVCETDDAFIGVPPYNPSFEGSNPARFPDRNRDWLHRCFRECDGISVSTPYLAELYGGHNEFVEVIGNRLDWEMWFDAPQQSEVCRRRLRVGWMGDSRWRMGDLRVLQGVLGPWLERHPSVDFVAAGDPGVHEILGVPRGQRVSVQGVDFHHLELADITAVMDVGLVPLAANKFNESKSYLKGLEYGACGVPCVASPTQQYQEWVEEGCNGFLAAKPKDWVRALDQLFGDDELRRSMGRSARVKAASLTIQEGVGLWRSWFETRLMASSRSVVTA